MKILFFGDVYGKLGRTGIKKTLPALREKYEPDFVLANVENMTHGCGSELRHIAELQKMGVDGFTHGNHAYLKDRSLEAFSDEKLPLCRPANFGGKAPGKRYFVLEKDGQKLFVTNLIGRVFMHELADNPFKTADEILKIAKKEGCKNIFVDMHAEVTSEKIALGYHLDGRVSAVIGTHTHVATADERILPAGTAFQSDVGMNGPLHSIIGSHIDCVQPRFVDHTPWTRAMGEKPIVVSAVFIETDMHGKAKKIERISETIS